eukprot:5277315-Alexandrium_andersonii.AAC.1
MAPRSGGRSARRPWLAGWERGFALCDGIWGRAPRSLPSPPGAPPLGLAGSRRPARVGPAAARGLGPAFLAPAGGGGLPAAGAADIA